MVWFSSTAIAGSFRLAAHAGVGADGKEGEHGQQAATPRQRDEDVMPGRAAEYQRPAEMITT
jgi:hypothetical protein